MRSARRRASPPVPTGLTTTGYDSELYGVLDRERRQAFFYNVYRSTTPGGEGSTPYLTYQVNTTVYDSVVNGTTYYYQIAAVGETGTSNKSSEVTGKPVPVPVAPTGLTATAGTGKITLSWQATASAAGYNIYRSTSPGLDDINYLDQSTTTTYSGHVGHRGRDVLLCRDRVQ